MTFRSHSGVQAGSSDENTNPRRGSSDFTLRSSPSDVTTMANTGALCRLSSAKTLHERMSDEELTSMISASSLEDRSSVEQDSPLTPVTTFLLGSPPDQALTRCPELDPASRILKDFLLKHSPAFVKANELRERGWQSKYGDIAFDIQRKKADNATLTDELVFYKMMIRIGKEMHERIGVLRSYNGKVLDLCMAPGGYSAAALDISPNAEIYGITLPVSEGGHAVLLDTSKLKGLRMLDITMLKTEFSALKIPTSHPNYSKFNPQTQWPYYKFGLVLCDGIKLRTQKRAEWREDNEVTRLATSQLILALQRIQNGGTLIMLMHKVDMWPSVEILYTFHKFAQVSVFKPKCAHQARSSFYMIAQHIDSEADAAKNAIMKWRQVWWRTTCGGDDGTGEKAEEPTEEYIQGVINDFGTKLLDIGKDAWEIQAEGLGKTSYAGKDMRGS